MKLQYSTNKSALLFAVLLSAAIACNLPFGQSTQEPSPVTVAQSNEPEPTPTTVIQNQRQTAQADSQGTTEDNKSEDPPDAPDTASEPNITIQPGEAPAIPDCSAFDVNVFNDIIGGTFSFVTQDQLNNCHYESDNDFRLLIGGGKPVTVAEIEELFDSSFGQLPDSIWSVYEDFYLGLAYSSVSVTAQGVSTSGHSIVIVAASQPSTDPAALQAIFRNLAQEAASQLNAQFQ